MRGKERSSALGKSPDHDCVLRAEVRLRLSVVEGIRAWAKPYLVYCDLQCAVLDFLIGMSRVEGEHIVRLQIRYAFGDIAGQVFVFFEDLAAALVSENRQSKISGIRLWSALCAPLRKGL